MLCPLPLYSLICAMIRARVRFTELKMCNFDVHCSLDDAVWDVRIHFDAHHNLDRKICNSDVTYLNLYALMRTQGFNFSDELYHMGNTCIGVQREHALDLIDTNIKLQQIKKQNEDSLVLNLLVRATSFVSTASHVSEEKLATVLYEEPVVYDLRDPPVLAVNDHGVVYESQSSNSSAVVQPAGMCTQESRNVSKRKLKFVMEEEEEEGYKSTDDSQGAYDSDNNPFCMKKYRIAEDTEIIEGKRLADAELEEDADSDEETDEDSDKEHLHYEGDTEVG